MGKIRAAMLLFGRGHSNDYLKLFLTRAVYSENTPNRPIRAFRANKCILFFSLSFQGSFLFLYTGLSEGVQCYFKPPFPVES